MAESFKYGNGVWATKEGLSMAYNDENDNYKPVPFSVTRDSIATRVNKQGLIEVVGKDKLRIDYTDTSKGVALLEPARTNLYPYSEDFTQWSQPNATVTLTSNEAPDGTTNSVYNLSGTNANLYYGGTTGVEHTISFYIKSNGQGKDKFKLRLGNNTSEEFTATAEWIRYSFTSTPATAVFGITTSSAPNNEFDLLVWGAQSEQASYATSYIPTSGSAVTRAADVANGAGNSEVFNDSEGVLFADVSSVNDGNYKFIGLSDGTATNRLGLFIGNSNNKMSVESTGSGTNLGIYDKDIITENNNKIALKYKPNDCSLWVNGFELGVDTSFAAFSDGTMTKLSFDRGDGNNEFYGKSKRVGYFDAILTDAELEALTSYTSFTNMANELNLTIK